MTDDRSRELAGAVKQTTTVIIPAIDSGLPFGSQKPENIARLERSREQLKRYHETGKWNDDDIET